ncbi:hypothetical protein P879_01620 [Paragonimus westermani]|uniref:G-protein coupled receptors family 1 profile domain-containing protein n=1 Tax=Paragonimus westermani TaxID=34504 RepID=A0A8T0DY46_9TREM|nr:hypothetical protein P879_01620 [Paragonimus westermani]
MLFYVACRVHPRLLLQELLFARPPQSLWFPMESCSTCALSGMLNSSLRPTQTTLNFTSIQSSTTSYSDLILPTVSVLIGTIGLIGNALNVLVLSAYHTSQITFGSECTARVNLLGLALADFLVCLASLPLGYATRRHHSYSFMLFYSILGPGLETYFLSVSVWMVLLMSVARYMAVCRPLTSRTWLTAKHMSRVIASVYVIALLFHIPYFLEFTFQEQTDRNYSVSTGCTTLINNQTEGTCDKQLIIMVEERAILNDQTVKFCYKLFHIIVTNIGPFVGVVISNLAVIRACRRSDACRHSLITTNPPTRTGAPFIGVQQGFTSQRAQQFLYESPYGPGHLHPSCHEQNYTAPGLFVLSPNSQCRLSLQRYPNRATNRVTPLLLAVIFAFLLFIAPFGILHFVCMLIMNRLGERILHDPHAFRLYYALNLTVDWTNVVQLLGCACNFFLYFLVSTTFRRTTKRTFQRLYKKMRTCRGEISRALFLGRSSHCSEMSPSDLRQRMPMLIGSTHDSARPLSIGISRIKPNSTRRGFLFQMLHRNHRTQSNSISLPHATESRMQSSPLPSLRRNEDSGLFNQTGMGDCSAGCDTYELYPSLLSHSDDTPYVHGTLTHCPKCHPLVNTHLSLPDNRMTHMSSSATTRFVCLWAHSEPQWFRTEIVEPTTRNKMRTASPDDGAVCKSDIIITQENSGEKPPKRRQRINAKCKSLMLLSSAEFAITSH